MTLSNGNIFRVSGPLWENPQITSGFPSQRPMTRSFDVFFDLRLNKRLSKQSRRWWFETTSHSLWRHGNGMMSCNLRQCITNHWQPMVCSNTCFTHCSLEVYISFFEVGRIIADFLPVLNLRNKYIYMCVCVRACVRVCVCINQNALSYIKRNALENIFCKILVILFRSQFCRKHWACGKLIANNAGPPFIRAVFGGVYVWFTLISPR